jgi:hypothetical protein
MEDCGLAHHWARWFTLHASPLHANARNTVTQGGPIACAS